MRDDQAKRFEEREARLGDEIARRWSRIPRPRAAGPSLLPSTDTESRLKAARIMEERLIDIIKTRKGEVKDLLLAEKELGIWRPRSRKWSAN